MAIQRKSTVDEVWDEVKRRFKEKFDKAVLKCAPDLASRSPHHLTQDEVDCIKKEVGLD